VTTVKNNLKSDIETLLEDTERKLSIKLESMIKQELIEFSNALSVLLNYI
jgi:hypothetical protein